MQELVDKAEILASDTLNACGYRILLPRDEEELKKMCYIYGLYLVDVDQNMPEEDEQEASKDKEPVLPDAESSKIVMEVNSEKKASKNDLASDADS